MAEVARTLVVSEGAVRVPLELLPELQPGESYCAQREGAAVVIRVTEQPPDERRAALARLRQFLATEPDGEEPPGLVAEEIAAYRRERDAGGTVGTGGH